MKPIIKSLIALMLLFTLGCVKIDNFPPNIITWELCYKVGEVEHNFEITGTEDAYYILYEETPYNILKVFGSKKSTVPVFEYRVNKEIRIVYFRRKTKE